MPKEATFQSRLLLALERRGGYWRKKHQDAISGDGDPDVYGCYRGHFVAFECKKPKVGRATRIQKLVIASILEEGGHAWFVTSIDEALAHLETVTWLKT